MGTLPRQAGALSQMSVPLGESQLLDVCVPSAGIVTPCKLDLDSEAQGVNPQFFIFPIRIVHAHKQQMEEINETHYIQVE